MIIVVVPMIPSLESHNHAMEQRESNIHFHVYCTAYIGTKFPMYMTSDMYARSRDAWTLQGFYTYSHLPCPFAHSLSCVSETPPNCSRSGFVSLGMSEGDGVCGGVTGLLKRLARASPWSYGDRTPKPEPPTEVKYGSKFSARKSDMSVSILDEENSIQKKSESSHSTAVVTYHRELK